MSTTPAMRLARELMSRAPYTFRPTDTVTEAAGRLVRQHHSGAPVVAEDGTFLGILSEVDLIRALEPLAEGCVPEQLVEEIMSTDVLWIPPDATVFDLIAFFDQYAYRRAPVLEDGVLIGLVSRHDVLAALSGVARECTIARKDGQSPVPQRR